MIDTSFELAYLALALEFLFGSFAVLFVLGKRQRDRDKHHIADAAALVEKIESGENGRRSVLAGVFKDKYCLDEEEIPQVVDEFLTREKAFYDIVLTAYLNRGEGKLASIDDELTKVVAPWIELTPKNFVSSDEVSELADAKAQAEQELHQTKTTLETLLNEYNKAFNKNEALTRSGDPTPLKPEQETLKESESNTEPTAVDQQTIEDGLEIELGEREPEQAATQDSESSKLTSSVQEKAEASMTAKDLDALMAGLDSESSVGNQSA